MVEQDRGGNYTQILYGPTGGKLALMNGQTVNKAFIPLPGGATAVYTAGPTLSRFWHPDWLGSVRSPLRRQVRPPLFRAGMCTNSCRTSIVISAMKRMRTFVWI
jgi:hypothetical protein